MSFVCNICFKSYGRNSSLLRHCKDKHSVFTFNCDHCQYGCNFKSIMIKHLQLVHNFVLNNVNPRKRVRSSRIVCPVCRSLLSTYKQLNSHLSSEHGVTLTTVEITFSEITEFEKWKKEIEETNKCQYVSKVVERKLKHANCVRREYFCHRSYSADIKTSNRKRSVKSLGSNKMGCVCPSRIIVDIKGKLLNVTFFEKHIGHECEIVRTRIPKDERAKIAGKLKEGVTINRVLQDIRETGSGTHFERIHYAASERIYITSCETS